MLRRKATLLSVSAVAILVLAVVLVARLSNEKEMLSQAEIDALRVQYPICANEPTGVRMRPMTEDLALQILAGSDTMLYAESTGEKSRYTKKMELFSDDPELRAILDAESPEWDIADYYEYTVTVIRDTAGNFQEGDVITIGTLKEYEDQNPSLPKGARFIMNTSRIDDQEGRYWFGVNPWVFYVTESGYALTAFEEVPKMTTFSGIKADTLLEQLSVLKTAADQIYATQEQELNQELEVDQELELNQEQESEPEQGQEQALEQEYVQEQETELQQGPVSAE